MITVEHGNLKVSRDISFEALSDDQLRDLQQLASATSPLFKSVSELVRKAASIEERRRSDGKPTLPIHIDLSNWCDRCLKDGLLLLHGWESEFRADWSAVSELCGHVRDVLLLQLCSRPGNENYHCHDSAVCASPSIN